MCVDDTFDSSRDVVILDDYPEAGYSCWGEEAVSAVFKPLQSPPQIDIQTEDDELQLNDLDLDPDIMKVIQERAKEKLDKNKEYASKTLVFSTGLFIKMYKSL